MRAVHTVAGAHASHLTPDALKAVAVPRLAVEREHVSDARLAEAKCARGFDGIESLCMEGSSGGAPCRLVLLAFQQRLELVGCPERCSRSAVLLLTLKFSMQGPRGFFVGELLGNRLVEWRRERLAIR